MDVIDDPAIVRRAIGAWYRSGEEIIPNNHSYVASDSHGREYAVLINVNGPLAVYRLRNDGRLKRLRRWPSEIIGT